MKKLELINFSYNNKFYLFVEKNDGQHRLLMFELKIYKKDSSPQAKARLAKQAEIDLKAKKGTGITPTLADIPAPPECTDNEIYSFVLFYELNVGESKLWIDSINEKQDLIKYFMVNHDQVKIDKDGNTSMCYVTTLQIDDHDYVDANNRVIHRKKNKVMRCRVRGAIF